VTSRTHVVALTGAIRPDLPSCCVDCVFWQTVRGTTDARRKGRWVRAFEDDNGAWGRALFDADTFLGLLQYGPASAFPRARALPAGPPDADGILLTCSYLTDADPIALLERLVLEALADAKTRAYSSVDAFAVDGDPVERLVGHHTLFSRPTLERMGFVAERTRGPVTLMRLRLRGLLEAEEPAQAVAVHPAALPASG
jgi:hypothetical protein